MGLQARSSRILRAQIPPVRRLARDGWARGLRFAGGIRSRLDVSQDTVAITFDDGPDPRFTPRLLELLQRLEVRATFFVVGEQAQQYPQIVREIVVRGHAVGSHSATHPDPWTVGFRALFADYRDGRNAVEAACEQEVRLFRPPKGYVDTRGVAVMRKAGLRPWLWTHDLEDWRPGVVAADIQRAATVISRGDVMLLHDAIQRPLASSSLDRSTTLSALPALVSAIRARGLDFAVLT